MNKLRSVSASMIESRDSSEAKASSSGTEFDGAGMFMIEVSPVSIIEALTDRSLFTASAAYAYARRAALRGDGDADKADAAMGEAAQAAYKRQRALAAEALS